MKWISVEDELPKSPYDILVWNNVNRFIEVANYNSDEESFQNGSYCLENITHWMELPDEPEDQ